MHSHVVRLTSRSRTMRAGCVTAPFWFFVLLEEL